MDDANSSLYAQAIVLFNSQKAQHAEMMVVVVNRIKNAIHGGMPTHEDLNHCFVWKTCPHSASISSSKNLRGRLVIGTEVFSGSSVQEAERLVPEKLTRGTMFFKASVFNLPGKFTPVKVGMKNDNAVPEKLKDGS